MTKLAVAKDGTSGKCTCTRRLQGPSWFSDGSGVLAATRCNTCLGWEDPVEGERVQVTRRIMTELEGEFDRETLKRIALVAVTVTADELVSAAV